MAYKNKIRCGVALDPELDLRINSLSKISGLSKAQLCARLIETSLNNIPEDFSFNNFLKRVRSVQNVRS